MRVKCPHCGTFATVRTSQSITALTGVATYKCRNDVECGFSFKTAFEIIGEISPPANRNQAVVLPILKSNSQRAQEKKLAPQEA